MIIGSNVLPSQDLDEKGIRFKTGAVPAAVNLCNELFATPATVSMRRNGKAAKSEVSQKTCQFKVNVSRIFGKKDR